MKKLVLMIIPALICGTVLTSCSQENESKFTGELCLKMSNGIIVSTSDIDFYDVSTHTFVLKEKLPKEPLPNLEKHGLNHDTMSVYVDGIEIYECVFHSIICSHFPSSDVYAFVYTFDEERKSTITVCFHPLSTDSTDPRSDERIIAALKKTISTMNDYAAKLAQIGL